MHTPGKVLIKGPGDTEEGAVTSDCWYLRRFYGKTCVRTQLKVIPSGGDWEIKGSGTGSLGCISVNFLAWPELREPQ